MIALRSLGEVPAGFGPSAVTIGKFDGVHLGHRAIVGDLVERAAAAGLRSVVVTFDRHPLALLAPDRCPPPLVSTEQKLALLAGTGVDATLLLPFDEALARLSPEEFAERVLAGALGARVVVVGEDFRFGHRNAGDVEQLTRLGERLGFEVVVVPEVLPSGERRASSSWIRELLLAGDVARAAGLLGQVHAVRGEVVHGAKRGRELGFPTANLEPDPAGLVPADGVYAGRLVVDGERLPAAVSVGDNPTFDGVPRRQVEAYVIDGVGLDLYGRLVDVTFAERIRGQVAYEGVGPLIAQMGRDVEDARRILADPAGWGA